MSAEHNITEFHIITFEKLRKDFGSLLGVSYCIPVYSIQSTELLPILFPSFGICSSISNTRQNGPHNCIYSYLGTLRNIKFRLCTPDYALICTSLYSLPYNQENNYYIRYSDEDNIILFVSHFCNFVTIIGSAIRYTLHLKF